MQRLMWKFLIGYVTITLEGMYLEAFLTEVCKKHRIKAIKRPSYTTVVLTVSAKHRNSVLSAAEKRGLRCIGISEDAAASTSAGIFRKWWMSISAVIIIIASIWISGHCFRIDFIGNEMISEFNLSALLEEHQISAGMRKNQIDLLEIKNLLYRTYPSLAYAEAYFDGTTLCIVMQEGNRIPEIPEEDPCSIAAEKRGVLLSLTVGEGLASAEVGDIVEAGQVLIRGAYTKKEHDFLVHARGSVIAQVDYIGRSEISLANGLVRTGNTAEVHYLAAGRMKVPLAGNNPYKLFETEESTVLTIPENMPAFLRIVHTIYHECRYGISEQTRDSAEAEIREKAYYSALRRIPDDAEIIDFYSVISEQNGKLCATATVTVKEEIATEVPADPEDIEKTEETGDT